MENWPPSVSSNGSSYATVSSRWSSSSSSSSATKSKVGDSEKRYQSSSTVALSNYLSNKYSYKSAITAGTQRPTASGEGTPKVFSQVDLQQRSSRNFLGTHNNNKENINNSFPSNSSNDGQAHQASASCSALLVTGSTALRSVRRFPDFAIFKRRQKIINQVKLQSEYINYRQQLKREKRRKGDPESPDVYENCSTNSFAVQVAIWKQMLREYRPTSRENGSSMSNDSGLARPKSASLMGTPPAVVDAQSQEDLQDRFTKMLAVQNENEDPLSAGSFVETPVSGHGSSLNHVSNHSSGSSGFGSGGASSPNSSFVTAPNSDDSSGGSGDWISVGGFSRRTSNEIISHSKAPPSGAKSSNPSPSVSYANRNRINQMNNCSIFNRKPNNPRYFHYLGSEEAQLTNCGKRKSGGSNGGGTLHRGLLADGTNYGQAMMKKEKRRESDQTTLARRQKQINMGKNTLGYQCYSEMVPREKRAKHEPKTPDIFQVCSRRSWDMQVRIWRRMLHKYDPPDAGDGSSHSLQDEEIDDDIFDVNDEDSELGTNCCDNTSSLDRSSPPRNLPSHLKTESRSDDLFINKSYPFAAAAAAAAAAMDQNENFCRINDEFSDVMQDMANHLSQTFPRGGNGGDVGDGASLSGGGADLMAKDNAATSPALTAVEAEQDEAVKKILRDLLDDSDEDDENGNDGDRNDEWLLSSPELGEAPSSNQDSENSFFGGGLSYGSADQECSNRAPPQLATFSSPPPIFSTPCRYNSNSNGSAKRTFGVALDFSGLFPSGGGGGFGSKSKEGESDSGLWSNPSETEYSAMSSTRSKEDPSFEELCEQTRKFEEARVVSATPTPAPVDENTQTSWAGFDGACSNFVVSDDGNERLTVSSSSASKPALSFVNAFTAPPPVTPSPVAASARPTESVRDPWRSIRAPTSVAVLNRSVAPPRVKLDCDMKTVNACYLANNNHSNKNPNNNSLPTKKTGVDAGFAQPNNSFGPFNVAPPPCPVIQSGPQCVLTSIGSQAPLNKTGFPGPTLLPSQIPHGTAPFLLTIPPPSYKANAIIGPLSASTAALTTRPPPSLPNVQQHPPQQFQPRNNQIMHLHSRSHTFPMAQQKPFAVSTSAGSSAAAALNIQIHVDSGLKTEDGLSKAEKNILHRQSFRNPSPPRPILNTGLKKVSPNDGKRPSVQGTSLPL